jgi:hypothetical protein
MTVNLPVNYMPFVAVPKALAPSMNVIVPVGVPLEPAIVALKVTRCPKSDGVNEVFTAVVLACATTTWLTAVDVLVLWFPESLA